MEFPSFFSTNLDLYFLLFALSCSHFDLFIDTVVYRLIVFSLMNWLVNIQKFEQIPISALLFERFLIKCQFHVQIYSSIYGWPCVCGRSSLQALFHPGWQINIPQRTYRALVQGRRSVRVWFQPGCVRETSSRERIGHVFVGGVPHTPHFSRYMLRETSSRYCSEHGFVGVVPYMHHFSLDV